ncbi:MAG TPA: B12-binding domain-containing radical SAM protein [Terriglobales bacterium]|nr:B12-binding domain-containing radical SAM protein [Terriglobales bacterium]
MESSGPVFTPLHPKGIHAKVLLTSVFGPYAQDDEFGSRAINPMELYHNQVTREQGSFSLRMFHRSWGLMMIQQNISAPSTLLDFPTLDIFDRELTAHAYDIVGISGIIPNFGKVREMCRRVRQLSPQSMIVVGGHVAGIPGIENMVDADHLVKGEGIGWMRRFLGEDPDAPIVHPEILSGFGFRVLGIGLPDNTRDTAATIIPSVGCPMGCNFCTTSAFFGGKGKTHHFYESGDELFEIMQHMERSMGVQSFFVMDENFLLNRPRALQLLRRMEVGGKSWALYVFSSINAIRRYSMEELVRLGISWIWVGLESPQSGYAKLHNADTRAIVAELRSNGIKLLGSTIVGLEHHTPENVREDMDNAIAHGTDFHQFMLYTPVPGTPLYQQMTALGRMLDDVDLADIHGQYKFNFVHAAISRDQSKELLDGAFRKDFEVNGPSLFRICQTLFNGWRRYKSHPEARVRTRFEHEAYKLRTTYNAALWAMERRLISRNRTVAARIRTLRRAIESEFGLPTKLLRMLLGPVLVWTSWREERRLSHGVTYEPTTFIERHNWLREAGDGTKFKVVEIAQRGFRPVLHNIAARARVTEEPELTVIGD